MGMKIRTLLVSLSFFSLLVVAGASRADADEAGSEGSGKAPPPALSSSMGLEKASGEKLAAAIGHYARSRSLLIAAINEFDKGYKIANPNALLDSKEWKSTLVDRAEELQRVLDPQPRASKGGVRFDADTRLLNEATK